MSTCISLRCPTLTKRDASPCDVLQDAALRGSIKLVQIKGPNTGWQSMNNVWGASWESTSIPDPPLDFRIQDDQGTEVRRHTHSPAEVHGVLICTPAPIPC